MRHSKLRCGVNSLFSGQLRPPGGNTLWYTEECNSSWLQQDTTLETVTQNTDSFPYATSLSTGKWNKTIQLHLTWQSWEPGVAGGGSQQATWWFSGPLVEDVSSEWFQTQPWLIWQHWWSLVVKACFNCTDSVVLFGNIPVSATGGSMLNCHHNLPSHHTFNYPQNPLPAHFHSWGGVTVLLPPFSKRSRGQTVIKAASWSAVSHHKVIRLTSIRPHDWEDDVRNGQRGGGLGGGGWGDRRQAEEWEKTRNINCVNTAMKNCQQMQLY